MRIEIRITTEGRRMAQATGTVHTARCAVLIPVFGIRYSVFCVLTMTVTVTGTVTGTGTGPRSGHAHSNKDLGSIEFERARCSVFCVKYSMFGAQCSVCISVQLCACSILDQSMVRWPMVDGRFSILDSRISNSHLTVCLTLMTD